MALSAMVISHGQTVGFIGDSTSSLSAGTAWYDPYFTAAVNASFGPVPAPVATYTGLKASFTGLPAVVRSGTTAPPIIVIDGGISGQTVSGVDARMASFLSTNHPDVVFIAVGTNDILFSTDPTAFATSYASALSKIQAYRSGTPTACMSIYMRGESWGAGPVWVDGGSFPGGTNAAVDQFNGLIATAAASAGAQYVDTRSRFLTWEVTNNPGQANTGHATSDGIHLVDAGKAAISPFVLAAITVQA